MPVEHRMGNTFDAFARSALVAQQALARVHGAGALALVVACAIHLMPGAPVDEHDAGVAGDPPVGALTAASVTPAGRSESFLDAPAGSRRTGAAQESRRNLALFLSSRYSLALEQMQEFVDLAYRAGREAKIDPLLILAVAAVESSFDPTAQSTRGAQGLMQVHTRVHQDKFAPFGGAAAAFDPLASMKVGAQILKDYLLRDGSIEGALKAYVGAGPMANDNGYGARVLSEREQLAAAAGGQKAQPPLLTRPMVMAAQQVGVLLEAVVAPVVQAVDARFSPAAADPSPETAPQAAPVEPAALIRAPREP